LDKPSLKSIVDLGLSYVGALGIPKAPFYFTCRKEIIKIFLDIYLDWDYINPSRKGMLPAFAG